MLVIDDLGHEMYRAEGIPTSPDAVNRALRWNNCVPHPTWFGKRAVFENGYRQFPCARIMIS